MSEEQQEIIKAFIVLAILLIFLTNYFSET